jgi:uncharacterized protein YdiU (UPF0061 family)
VAPSFIRFGSFEILASQNDLVNLKLLTDFTPFQLLQVKEPKNILRFAAVAESTRKMIIEWQRRLVHGVMNTDNMSIHGINDRLWTVWLLEDYNAGWTQILPTDIKDTALATNLKLLCGICTNWRMLVSTD